MGVATAVAIGGLAISAGSTAMSFAQASQQRKAQRNAEAKAAEAMAEARKKLSINYAKERSIQKEPYELQREAMLSAGSQLIQAGVESDRGAETTAGKIFMAQNEAQGGLRTSMGQDLTEIEKEIIDEQSRLRDLGVQLDLGEVEGAQLAARDAQEAAASYETAGYKGIADTAQMGLNMIPLFSGKDAAESIDPLTAQGVTSPKPQKPTASLPMIPLYQNRTAPIGSMYDPFSIYQQRQ